MIKIYTDGSCIGNPGKGGWAAIIFKNNEKKILKGSKDITLKRFNNKQSNGTHSYYKSIRIY